MQRVNARLSCAGRDGENRLSFEVRIKQLQDVSLARSCRRLHHHIFSLLQRAHCLLLPQIGNGADGISDIEGKVARVATSKLGNERVSITNPAPNPGIILWKMFAVWPACNGADGISDIEGKVTRVGASECGQRASFNRDSDLLFATYAIDTHWYFVQHAAMSYAGLTYGELSARFSELRQAVIGDRRAPHKPLLVLLMLGQIPARKLCGADIR